MNSLLTVLIENASEEDLRKLLKNVDEDALMKALTSVLNIQTPRLSGNCPVAEASQEAVEMAERLYGSLNYDTTPENALRIFSNVKCYARSNSKVEAVKYVRQMTGCGLKKGLDFVNFVIETQL